MVVAGGMLARKRLFRFQLMPVFVPVKARASWKLHCWSAQHEIAGSEHDQQRQQPGLEVKTSNRAAGVAEEAVQGLYYSELLLSFQ